MSSYGRSRVKSTPSSNSLSALARNSPMGHHRHLTAHSTAKDTTHVLRVDVYGIAEWHLEHTRPSSMTDRSEFR
eukprot:scaffold72977_cov87-Cyclotella_meneghiniana.AAC.1